MNCINDLERIQLEQKRTREFLKFIYEKLWWYCERISTFFSFFFSCFSQTEIIHTITKIINKFFLYFLFLFSYFLFFFFFFFFFELKKKKKKTKKKKTKKKKKIFFWIFQRKKTWPKNLQKNFISCCSLFSLDQFQPRTLFNKKKDSFF